ncbi:MAG TPA: flagellin [Microvirga sp.]|jgi:flagellin-like hook-associated protein FlgL
MAITLSSGVRQALASIQSTAAQASVTQNRLATGKKVNSALDNPASFFKASGLNNRANDLTRLMDDMGQSVKTLEAADKGIKAITKLVENAQSIATQAKSASDTTTRTNLGNQFDEILTQIDELAQDAGYNGVNLLQSNSLSVKFNEKVTGASKLDITGVDRDSGGLGLSAAAATWDGTATANNTAIDTQLTNLGTALNTLRSTASTFGSNLSVVQNRVDFTKGMIDTLNAGADALVSADPNEEGANLLALQTRAQLSGTALSMASQADQAVLRLF